MTFTVVQAIGGSRIDYQARDLNDAHEHAMNCRMGLPTAGSIVEIYAADGAFVLGWVRDNTGWSAYVESTE